MERTALARARRTGLVRNAALVLGARGSTEAIEGLIARLDDRSEDPSVRASAAWALGRIGSSDAKTALARHSNDCETLVRDSVARALEHAKLITNQTSEGRGE
jgi:epoxyqueuosine reductase